MDRLVELVTNTIHGINYIYDEIGYTKEDCDIQTRRAYTSIKDKLKELEKEAQDHKKNLIRDLEHLGDEVCQLSECLQEDPNKISEPDSELSLLELQSYLLEKLQGLKVEASKRKKIYAQLKSEEMDLCNELCEDPLGESRNDIPSKDEIHYKKQIVETLKVQLVQRRKQFNYFRTEIIEHMGELQRGPSTSFERDVFSENEDPITLSTRNLQDMKKMSVNLAVELEMKQKQKEKLTGEINVLSERLEMPILERKAFFLSLTGKLIDDLTLLVVEKERLQEIRHQNMGRFIVQLRQELRMWWDSCYTSEEDREVFTPFYDNDYTEELLQAHEVELNRMKALYERDSIVFKKVGKWCELWNKVTELEEKANDPKRLFGNRGCSLLQEERERKRVNKLLPKTEAELKILIKNAEEERAEPFLVCGLEFTDFIKTQWETYNHKKLKEKMERQEAKTKQLQLDARIGTGKVSLKRPLSTRNVMQISKYMKTGENQRTPVGSSSKASRCSSARSVSSQYKPRSRLFTLKESSRGSRDQVDSTVNSTEVSSYMKFSERLHTMSERENIHSSVLLPPRGQRTSRLNPKALPRTPRRSSPPVRNARTVPSNFQQRKSSRLNTIKNSPFGQRTLNSPNLRITPVKNKLSFLM